MLVDIVELVHQFYQEDWMRQLRLNPSWSGLLSHEGQTQRIG